MKKTFKWENFQDIASFHGHADGHNCSDTKTLIPCSRRPCPGKGQDPCCPHSGTEFLTWHRLYMVQLEELMEPWLAGTNLGLPYWDWTKDWDTIPDLWEGIRLCIKDSHAFYSYWSCSNCQGRNKDFSQRIKEDLRTKDSYFSKHIEMVKRRKDFTTFTTSRQTRLQMKP